MVEGAVEQQSAISPDPDARVARIAIGPVAGSIPAASVVATQLRPDTAFARELGVTRCLVSESACSARDNATAEGPSFRAGEQFLGERQRSGLPSQSIG